MNVDAGKRSSLALYAAAVLLVFFSLWAEKMIGGMNSSLLRWVFGRVGFSPAAGPQHLGLVGELASLVFAPGLISGALIGARRVQALRDLWKGLLPSAFITIGGIVVLGSIELVIGRGDMAGIGTYFFFLVSLTTWPFALLGTILGYSLSRLRAGRVGGPSTLAAIVGLLILVSAQVASAWDNTVGHRKIVEQGVTVLNGSTQNGFLEAQSFQNALQDGAEQEDSPVSNVLYHFHNPFTSRSTKGLRANVLTDLGFTIYQGDDADEKAASFWNDTLTLYQAGNKLAAYRAVGHIAHLVTGDMTQPQHVHDDPHAPHFAGFLGDSQVIEDNYQANVSAFSSAGLAPVIPSGASPLTSDGIKAFGQAASLKTYLYSRFSGLLTNTNVDGAIAGRIDFPGGAFVNPIFVAKDPLDSNADLQVDHYRIGDSNPQLYDPTIRGDMGFNLSLTMTRHQDWWELPADEETPTQQQFYFDQYQNWTISGQRMDNFFMKTAIPDAYSYTAGLLKAAAQAFDSVKPTIELRQNDSQGSIIQPGGAGGSTIYLKAKDPGGSDPGGDPNYPTPSGVYKISLKNTDTGNEVAVTPALDPAGENPAERTFSNLAEGHYELKVFDGTGNDTSVTFEIRAPVLSLGWEFDGREGYRLFHGIGASSPTPSFAVFPGPDPFMAADGNAYFGFPLHFLLSDPTELQTIALTRVSDNGTLPLFGFSAWTDASAQVGIPTSGFPISIPPGYQNAQGGFIATGVGSFVFTATNRSGLSTVAPFRVTRVVSLLDRANSFAFFNGNSFEGQVRLNFEASEGLQLTEQTDLQTRTPMNVQQLGGAPTSQRTYGFGDLQPIGNSIGVAARAIDRDGHGGFAFVTLDVNPHALTFSVLDATQTNPTSSFTSQTFDSFNLGFMPGGIVDVDPASYSIGFRERPGEDDVSGPIYQDGPAGHIVVTLNTDSQGGGTSGPVVDVTVDPSRVNPTVLTPRHLGRFWSLTYTLQSDGVIIDCFDIDPNNPSFCLRGRKSYPVFPVDAITFHGYNVRVQEGSEQYIPIESGLVNAERTLGHGISVSNINTSYQPINVTETDGFIGLRVTSARADPGYRALPRGIAYDLFPGTRDPGVGLFDAPVTWKFRYDPTGLTAAQQNAIRLVKVSPEGRLSDDLPIARTPGVPEVSYTSAQGGQFMLLVPDMPEPRVLESGPCSFVYDQSATTQTLQMTAMQQGSPELRSLLADAAFEAQEPIGTIVEILPEHVAVPGAAIRCRYSPELFASLGGSSKQLIELSDERSPATLSNQFSNYDSPLLAANVDFVNSFFGSFARTVQRDYDTVAPQTMLSYSPAADYSHGIAAITTGTAISLAALDPPMGNSQVSGVAATYFLVDQSFVSMALTPPTLYSSSFTLSAGTHTITYFSSDLAENFEAPVSTQVVVASTLADRLPPRTTLRYNAAAPGTPPFVSTATAFVFSAVDDWLTPLDGRGMVQETRYTLDGAAAISSSRPFSIAGEGIHSISFYSIDAAGNVEASTSVSVAIDLTPPTVTLVSTAPALFSLSAFDPATHGPASGVGQILYAVDVDLASCGSPDPAHSPIGSCGNPFYQGPFFLSNGTHTISYAALDAVGNGSGIFYSSAVIVGSAVIIDTRPPADVDSQPPVTTLFAANRFGDFVRSGDVISLGATDSMSGVAGTFYTVNPSSQLLALGLSTATSGQFAVYSGPFTPPPSARSLAYGSTDNAGNSETLHVARFDSDVPVTAASAQDNGAGSLVITLSALDQTSGVRAVYYTLNPSPSLLSQGLSDATSGQFLVYAGTFTVASGVSVAYGAADNVGHYETLRVLSLDSTPPVTTIQSAGLFQGFVKSNTPITLTATDVGTGVDAIYYAVSASTSLVAGGLSASTLGQFQRYFGPFSIFGGGVLAFGAADKAGNYEALQTVTVDSAPPATSLFVQDEVQDLVRPGAALSLSASDGGSGVAGTYYGVDLSSTVTNQGLSGATTGFYQLYASPFTLAAGQRRVNYGSVDRVGNYEFAHFATFRVDGTSPTVTFFVSFNGQVQINANDPFVNGVSAGVSTSSIRYLVDVTPDSCAGVVPDANAPRGSCANQVYAGPFTPQTGPHTIYASAPDRVGNGLGLYVSTSVVTPNLAPTTTLLAPGGFQDYVKEGAQFSFSVNGPQPPFATYYKVDPSPALLAAGLSAATTAQFDRFFGSFGLLEGARTIAYGSADNSGHYETLKTASYRVDGTRPSVALVPNGALYALAAVDPVQNGVASGLQGVFYVVDTDPNACTVPKTGLGPPGTCANPQYQGPFALAVGTHTVYMLAFDNVNNQTSTSAAVTVAPIPPPTLTLLPANGSTVTSVSAVIEADYVDAFAGVSTASARMSVDGVDVTAQLQVTASAARYAPPALAQGAHAVVASVANLAGVVATATAAWTLDSLPPVTTLLIDGTPSPAPSLVIKSTNTLGFAALDAGVGVAQTRYSLDNGFPVVYAATFTLAAGAHTLSYQSVDNAGNQEPLKFVSLTVENPVGYAPTAAILSPEAGGFLADVEGAVPVVGTLGGTSLVSWTLETAAGANASFGFNPLASGTAAVSSGTLAVWNTSTLAGWQTLRLTAFGAGSQRDVASENVYVGDPSLLLAFSGDLSRPMGVAVSVAGNVYVADTDNDRVDVFNSLGGLIRSIGGTGPQGANVKKPEGVAVDVFGNVYVADTNNGRALKLSALGQPLVAFTGLGRPVGIALDADKNVYVSDADKALVQKFGPAGMPLQTFPLPGSKPAGIAVDAAARLYVADIVGQRVVVFSSTGAVLATLGATAGLSKPYGVAVSPSGDTLAISDFKSSRIVSLDRSGAILQLFGGKDSGLMGPRGLAFDAAGFLFVAERNRDRVIKLGPPAPGLPFVPLMPRQQKDGDVVDLVSAKSGGKLWRSDHAALIVPAGALADDLELNISTPIVRLAEEEALKDRKLDEAGLVSVSTGVVFGPYGTSVQAPVTVVIPYDQALASALGVPELGLQVQYWDPDKQKWYWLSSVVDPLTRTASAKTTRFSLCKVAGKKPAPPPAEEVAKTDDGKKDAQDVKPDAGDASKH